MARKPNKPGKRTTTKKVQATENKPFTMPEAEVKPEDVHEPLRKDGLSVRQSMFVDALVGPAGGNATKAAEMAGYAADNRNALFVTASRLLSFAKVQEAIAFAYAKLRASPEWAKNALMDLAGSSMANFLSVDEQGQAKLDFTKAAELGALGQIKEYKEDGFSSPAAGPVIIKRAIKIHDRQQAVTTLLKLHGLLKEHVELSGGLYHTKDVQGVSDDDL